jgi:hypothetical protein
MGDVPLIDADRFLQCGRPANIPEAALRERLLLAGWSRWRTLTAVQSATGSSRPVPAGRERQQSGVRFEQKALV